MKKILVVLAFMCVFSFTSCRTYEMTSWFSVYVYDDNNVLIRDERELKKIKLTFVGEDRYSYKRSISIEPDTYNQYFYCIELEMSEVNSFKTDKYMNDFKSSLKTLGIKIEDKKGRYKTKVLYPFKTEANETVIAGTISVKLEKK